MKAEDSIGKGEDLGENNLFVKMKNKGKGERILSSFSFSFFFLDPRSDARSDKGRRGKNSETN